LAGFLLEEGCAMNLLQRFVKGLRPVCRIPTKIMLAALVGLAAGRNLTPTVSVVDGASMDPTLPAESRIVSRAITRPLERGDIVLMLDPQGERVVKRIVGLPGEVVAFCRGYVFINDQLLREPYLPKYTFTVLSSQSKPRTALGSDQYFVLGDNRKVSLDSRKYGPVRRGQILMLVTGQENRADAWLDHYRVAANNTRWIEASAR
jgi:signal peptidase I